MAPKHKNKKKIVIPAGGWRWLIANGVGVCQTFFGYCLWLLCNARVVAVVVHFVVIFVVVVVVVAGIVTQQSKLQSAS